jgi:hypothetical protein
LAGRTDTTKDSDPIPASAQPGRRMRGSKQKRPIRSLERLILGKISMWQKRVMVAALTLAIAPVLSAQKAQADDPVGVTATEIKVGATFPFSGPASALAMSARR